MAVNTPPSLCQSVIYEVYLRNHGDFNTFDKLVLDLPRIKALGVDIIWLMPIHPIGQLNKKGSLGCPYSIQDYRSVNPEYGTEEDFVHLISAIHGLGMKLIIDVVYHHTSHDSVLISSHPEWYRLDSQGKPYASVPEWSDIIDLKFSNGELWSYLIDCLCYWSRLGVDGFRCDVASFLPVDFWGQARAKVSEVNADAIWLAETVEASQVVSRRREALYSASDCEMYRAFDITYDYDIWMMWKAALQGKCTIPEYIDLMLMQDALYPQNFIKMRMVENHDQARIMKSAQTRERALAWTAFQAFNRGAFLIYAGQECGATSTPSLFDVEKIELADFPFSSFLAKLASIKKDAIVRSGLFTILSAEPAIVAQWHSSEGALIGVFNVGSQSGIIEVPLPDGVYRNFMDDSSFVVEQGTTDIPRDVLITSTSLSQSSGSYKSALLSP